MCLLMIVCVPIKIIILSQSYKLTINPMLLVTVIRILTGPDTLTVLLEYINLFQSQSQWQYKVNIWEEMLILGLTLPYIYT